MSNISEGVYSYLTGKSAITALVSTRIYPTNVPDDATYPCIRYVKVSGNRFPQLGRDASLVNPRFQFDCYGRTYTSAKQVSEALRVALQSHIDGSGTNTWSGVWVQGVQMDGETDSFDEETGLYNVSTDYFIWHIETTS